MSEDRKKLDDFIKATDKRVKSWSEAQREAIQEAFKRKSPRMKQQGPGRGRR